MKLFNAVIVFAFFSSLLLFSTAATNVFSQNLLMQEVLGDDIGGNNLEEDPVKFSAWFRLNQGTREGVLSLKADIASHWHLYSVTQPQGGPITSKISLAKSDQYELTGEFEPDADPHVIEKDDVFGVRVEHHELGVVWSAPIKLEEGVDPSTLNLELKFQGQTCVSNEKGETGSCLLLSEKVKVSFDGFDQVNSAPAANVKFKPQSSHILLLGNVRRVDGPGVLKAGDQLTLKITAEPTDHYHVYAYEPSKSDDSFSNPTLFAFTKKNDWGITGPTASDEPITTTEVGITQSFHEDPVTWKFNISVPVTAENKTFSFAGAMGVQTCTDTCDPPDAVRFSFELPIGKEINSVPVKFVSQGDYGDVVKLVEKVAAPPAQVEQGGPYEVDIVHQTLTDTPEAIAEMASLYDADKKVNYLTLKELDNNPVGSTAKLNRAPATTLWTALFGAFVGGMLLNLMPCVFPVLGLKIMGFVEQAGSEPKKIRMHGIAFAMGLIVSMWALAGVILTLKLAFGQSVNWGQQMGNPYFVCAIIVLLFLLGLNMAGVFELGTSMTRVGGSSQGKKGYLGSFLSGILTTLIATPCSGPFLGAAMSYTLAQPAMTAMFLFTVFALGISAPYLLLSFYPVLIKMLPRPGAWMETFKVTMAFALFATVAFFMNTFGGQTGVAGLSWLAMALVVLALAAYFYGHWSPPHIKPAIRRWFGYVMPALIAGVGLWMCYDAASQQSTATGNHTAGGLQWQQWNPGKIEYMLAKNKKVVWVDYTANW